MTQIVAGVLVYVAVFAALVLMLLTAALLGYVGLTGWRGEDGSVGASVFCLSMSALLFAFLYDTCSVFYQVYL